MKLFSTLFKIFKARKLEKQLTDSLCQYKANEEKYVTMSLDALKRLNDEELFDATFARLERKASRFDELSDALDTFNDAQKAFYSLYLLELEVNNGGLCQYFVNSSRATAPYVSDAMATVGAHEHKALFDGFIARNNIDLTDLSSFKIEDVEEFEERMERYPFDEYDDAFYDFEPLQVYLEKFARAKTDDLY